MVEEHKRVIGRRDKIAYDIAVLRRILDVGSQRIISPGVGYVHAVRSLEGILFPEDREEIDAYKFDTDPHAQEMDDAFERSQLAETDVEKTELFLNLVKPVSWILYKRELTKCFKAGSLPDVDFNGRVEQADVRIMAYEALTQKIIAVLKDHGWLIKGSSVSVGGGGVGFMDDLGIIEEKL